MHLLHIYLVALSGLGCRQGRYEIKIAMRSAQPHLYIIIKYLFSNVISTEK